MTNISYDGNLTLSFAVKDRNVSADWYAKHLGFTRLFDAAEIGWTEMQTPIPGVTAGFADAMDVKSGGCVPVLGVPDLEAARAALEAEGVRFDGQNIVHEGMVKLATFFDPDGNAWMLAQSFDQ
ncbi:MAG: VOC family protein [Robiginitomaculum sp.]|nr:VOC family protein [Robiginitomaculum sp.]